MYDSKPHVVELDQSVFLETASRKTLPSLPQIHARLMDACGADTIDHKTIATLIKRDPVLTLRLLNLSSPHGHHDRSPMPSVERALADTGMDCICNLAACSAFETTLGNAGLSWEPHREFWLHTIKCAATAELLAREVHFYDPGSAYLAGLLHDIGRLVLPLCFPDKYRLNDPALNEKEMQDHCRAGSWLIFHETGASFIADAALYHHAPPEKIATAFPLVQLVYVANLLAQPGSDRQALGKRTAKAVFDLDDSQVEALEAHATVMVEDICHELGVHHQPEGGQGIDFQAFTAPPPLAEHLKTTALASVLSRGLLKAGDSRELFQTAQGSLKLLFHIEKAYFFLHDDHNNTLVGQAGDDSAPSNAIAHLSIPMRPRNNLPVHALVKNEMISSFDRPDEFGESLIDSQLLHFLGTDGMLCLPLATRDKGVGTVVIGIERRRYPGLKRQANLLKMIILHVAEALLSSHLHQQREKQRHQSALAVLEEKTRKAVHEINNPLGAINNYLRVLEGKLSREGIVLDELRIVKDEMNRVIRLINNLAGKKIDIPSGPDPVNLNDTLTDIAGLFEQTLQQHDIEMHLELDSTTPPALLNRDHLKQIFLNLIKNALEAMADGGKILVKTEVVKSPPKDEPESDEKPARSIRCIVADDGPGIPEALGQSIFEPHITSKSSHAGLGLSVVRDLVEKLEGSIECDSQPDVGTCFTVVFPLAGHRKPPNQ